MTDCVFGVATNIIFLVVRDVGITDVNLRKWIVVVTKPQEDGPDA